MSFTSEEKLNLLRITLERSNDLIAIVDLEGKYLYKNPKLNQLLETEAKNISILSNVHTEDKEHLKTFLKEIINSGHSESKEYRLTDNHGKSHYLKSYGEIIKNQDNDINKIIIFSQERSSESDLVNEVKRLRTIVEQSNDEIVVTNKEGIVEYVNQAFLEDTGYSKEEAIGQTIRKLVSGKNDQSFYEDVWGKISCGQEFRGEVINKTKNGEYISVDKKITPIKDKNGNITHFVSTSKVLEREI